AGIAVQTLILTDVLGITNTGFADLFNSIRINGQGLATWLGKFWSYIEEGFENLRFGIASGWDWLVPICKGVAEEIYSTFSDIIDPIVAAFRWLKDKLVALFTWIWDGIKSIASAIGSFFGWVVDQTTTPELQARQVTRSQEHERVIEAIRAR